MKRARNLFEPQKNSAKSAIDKMAPKVNGKARQQLAAKTFKTNKVTKSSKAELLKKFPTQGLDPYDYRVEYDRYL